MSNYPAGAIDHPWAPYNDIETPAEPDPDLAGDIEALELGRGGAE